MAEEIIPETEPTDEIPNAPDGEAGRTPPPEAEGAGEPNAEETEATDEMRALWDEALPELAGAYDEMSPEARQRLLLKRQAAQPQSKPTTEEVPTGPSSNAEAETGAPPVAEIPAIDAKEQQAAIESAIENQDGAALASVLDRQRQYVEGLAQLAYTAVKDQDKVIADLSKGQKELRIPGQVQAALPTVQGADKADLAAAAKLLASGEVQSAELALKVAAFNRQSEIAAAKGSKPTADQEATKKAKALAASRAGAASSRAGAVAAPRIPVTQQALEDLLQADADKAAKK